tara:strand:+ start:3307 stop:3855 length:549 start_codon:yes stop_codon:yes gene_type:complete
MKETIQKTKVLKYNDETFNKINNKNRYYKYKAEITVTDFYKSYRETFKYKKFKSKYAGNTPLLVRQPLYRKIINDMFKLIAHDLVYKGTQFQLPCMMGTIGLRKRKMDFDFLLNENLLQIDYAASKKYKKIMYHTNDHSNNFRYKWKWKRREKNAYRFVPCRAMKREAAKVIKLKLNDFPEE